MCTDVQSVAPRPGQVQMTKQSSSFLLVHLVTELGFTSPKTQRRPCPGEPASCQNLTGSEHHVRFISVKATHFLADAQSTTTNIATCTEPRFMSVSVSVSVSGRCCYVLMASQSKSQTHERLKKNVVYYYKTQHVYFWG